MEGLKNEKIDNIMMEKMNEIVHKLLIKYNVQSKSKRFYLLFKPKDIIANEFCEVKLTIKNIGESRFPKSWIEKLYICDKSYEGTSHKLNIEINALKKGETYNLKPIETKIIKSGENWIVLKIKPIYDDKIDYFQIDHSTGKPTKTIKDEWEDCLYVATRQEIHQRYTNYFLIGLTIITTLLLVLSLIIQLS